MMRSYEISGLVVLSRSYPRSSASTIFFFFIRVDPCLSVASTPLHVLFCSFSVASVPRWLHLPLLSYSRNLFTDTSAPRRPSTPPPPTR